MKETENPVDVYVREGTNEALGVRIGIYRRALSSGQARALARELNEKADLADHGNEGAPGGDDR